MNDGMFWKLSLITSEGKVLTDNARNRNKRFARLVPRKDPLRGAFGPGMTEQGHNASSKTRLRNLRIQNCARSFDANVGEVRLIKAR
jgi:hypothetical protein